VVTEGSSVNFLFIVYLSKYDMISTREEKEKLVLDLYNQRRPIREIAKEAGMSFRDIGEGSKRRTNTTGVSVYTSIQALL